MWGNLTGWLISVVIAGAMGFMLFYLGSVEGRSEPSGEFKNLTQPIKLPTPAEDVVPGLFTQDRDAGEQYLAAINEYTDHPDTYGKGESFYARRENLPAVDLLVQAAPAKRATIFIRQPATVVNYRYPWPELDALYELGMIANSIAFSAQAKKDVETTKKYAHAVFSLGAKLYEERLVHGELDVGQKLMRAAGDTLTALARKTGNKAEQERWQRFGDSINTYYTTQIQKLYQKVVSGGPRDVGRYAGDVFELALNNPDRMWRVEAILKIGRLKFEEGRTGIDEMWAIRLLNEPQRLGMPDLTQDPDPAVRTAAQAAKDLTVEQFRQIR